MLWSNESLLPYKIVTELCGILLCLKSNPLVYNFKECVLFTNLNKVYVQSLRRQSEAVQVSNSYAVEWIWFQGMTKRSSHYYSRLSSYKFLGNERYI